MAGGTRWNPLDDFARVKGELAHFLGVALPKSWQSWSPSIDVRETPTHITVTAEVPGLEPGDLEVLVMEERLVLKGEVRYENRLDSEDGFRWERRHGAFHRVVPFPAPVKHREAIAEMRNGVLQLRVPKASEFEGSTTRVRLGRDVGSGKPDAQGS